MFYIINLPPGIIFDIACFKLKRKAKIKLLNLKLNANDILMENFIKDKYSVGLKQICFELITKKASFMSNGDQIIIKFLNPNDDKLARLITNGNGKISGSTILRDIFN